MNCFNKWEQSPTTLQQPIPELLPAYFHMIQVYLFGARKEKNDLK